MLACLLNVGTTDHVCQALFLKILLKYINAIIAEICLIRKGEKLSDFDEFIGSAQTASNSGVATPEIFAGPQAHKR